MSDALFIRNRQQTVPVNVPCLRRMAQALLHDLHGLPRFDLGIYLVNEAEMTRLNETFLQHKGSTDVITFDYAPSGRRAASDNPVHGEIFICLDEAKKQARRFRTTWQAELARYVIHGVLHLTGYDDRQAARRRRMKKTENFQLRELARRFPLRKLARASKMRG